MKFWFYDERGKVSHQQFSSQLLHIGRDPDNHFVIPNETVSSNHATVSQLNGAFILSDLNSTNGTIVNGDWISKTAISHGDILQFGGFECWFDEQESSCLLPMRRQVPDTRAPRQTSVYPLTLAYSGKSGQGRRSTNNDTGKIIRSLEKTICRFSSGVVARTFMCSPNGKLPKAIRESDDLLTTEITGEPRYYVITGKSGFRGNKNHPKPLNELPGENNRLKTSLKNAALLKIAFPIGKDHSAPLAILYLEHHKPQKITPGFFRKLNEVVRRASHAMSAQSIPA
ncbi:FHA domain-containing protein [Fibrobacterota bacterium]